MAKKDNIKPAGIKNWSKNAARSVRYVSIDLMKSAIPFTMGSVENIKTTTKDLRQSINDTRTSSGFLSRNLSRNNLGKIAKGYADDALEALKSGNLAIQQDEKDTFDSFGDMDFDFDDIGTTMDADGQTTVLPEAKIASKQSQEISKAILAGGGNTVSAIRNMTTSLSATNLKSSQALAAQLTNVTLLGIQQSSRDMAEVNTRLASINQNLVSMIEFNNNNVSVTNQAMMSYFDRSLEMLDSLQKGSDLRSSKSRTASSMGPDDDQLGFLSMGFDPKGYAKHIKKNFDNSMPGVMLGMAKTMMDMNKMMGEKPKSLTHIGLQNLLPLLIPSSMKKQGKAFDTNLGKMAKNALFNLGDMKSDYSSGFGPMGFLKRFVGEIFGAERTREAHISMGSFYKDEMSWNGMANRILIEAIPSYLANIESSLTGKGTRYYDPKTGRFKTAKKLKREYDEERDFAVQGAMSDTLQKLNTYLEGNEVDSRKKSKIQDQVNDLINERVQGNYSTKEYRDRVSSTLSGSLNNSQFENIILGLESGYEDAMKQMEDLRRQIESNHDYLGYRQINNDKQDLSKRNKARSIDAFQFSGRDSFSVFGGDIGMQIELSAETYISREAKESGFTFKVTPEFVRKYKEAIQRDEDFVTLDRMVEKEVKAQQSKERKKRILGKLNIGDRFSGFGNRAANIMGEADARLFKATSGYNNFSPIGAQTQRQAPPPPSPAATVGAAGSRATTDSPIGNARPNYKSSRGPRMKSATSRGAETAASDSEFSFQHDIQAAQANITGINDRSILEVDPARLTEEQSRIQKGVDASGEALLATTDTGAKMNSFMNVMGGMMLTIQNSFNSIFGGIFGKKGIIHKVWDSDWRKKFFAEMKEKLFNEDTGISKNQVKWLKANGKEIGKATIGELKGGWNKFHDYASRGFLGDDYENQEFYQKYLSKLRFNDKKDSPDKMKSITAQQNDAVAEEKELGDTGAVLALPGPTSANLITSQQNRGKKDARTQAEIGFANGPKRGPKKVTLNDVKRGRNRKIINYIKKNHPNDLERLMYLYTHPEEDNGESERIIATNLEEYNQSKGRRNKKSSTTENLQNAAANEADTEAQLPAVINQAPASTDKKKVNISIKGPKMTGFRINKPGSTVENAEATFALAIVDSAEKIKDRGEEVADTLMGKSDGPEQEKVSFWKRFKAGLPKTLAAGIAGAGISLLSGGSIGIIGSMFLPGGPIGGAIVGMGLSLVARNKKFQEFIFGKEDENGKKVGGLISNKMQASFKKALPFMASGAAFGIMKSLLLPKIIGGGASGILLNSLLPGGIIGGAVLGMGISLLKHNDTFNDIVFGKKDENGDRKRNYLGKGMTSVNKKMMGLMPKIKGGAKGLLAGAATGAVLSNMGVVGAALSLGGPVGMGLAGLGIGILSSTKKFNQYLFGHEELDEDGNPTGKRLHDGLLPRLKNLVVVNVLDPIKQQIEDSVVSFAYFAKKNIMYPFRLAFGPILDALGTLKDDIGSFVKDKFEIVAEGIGNVFKKVFDKITQPFTRILGKIGRGMVKTLETGAKIATLPITAPLKFASAIMSPARTMSQLGFYRSYFNTVNEVNAQDPNAPKSKLGKAAAFIKTWRNKDARAVAEDAWINDWTVNNGNHMDWRHLNKEKRDDKAALKARLKWKPVDKLRQKYVKEDRGNDTVYWTEAKMEKMRKELTSKGIDAADIASEADLRKLIYRKDDWKEDRAKTAQDRAAGIGETKEQAAAREHTSEYQEKSIDYLDLIYRTMVKMTQKEVDRQLDKKHGRSKDRRTNRLLKRLNKLGIDPADLGLDESTVLDVEDLTDMDWELYQDSEEHKTGDFTKWYNANLWRWNRGVKRPGKVTEEEKKAESEEKVKKAQRMGWGASWRAVKEMLHGKRPSQQKANAAEMEIDKNPPAPEVIYASGHVNQAVDPWHYKNPEVPDEDAATIHTETPATTAESAATKAPKGKKGKGKNKKGKEKNPSPATSAAVINIPTDADINKMTELNQDATPNNVNQETPAAELVTEIREQNQIAKEQLDAQHATNEAMYPPGTYDRDKRTKAVENRDVKAMSNTERDAASTTQDEMKSSVQSGMENALGWFSKKRKKLFSIFSKKKQEDAEDKHARALGIGEAADAAANGSAAVINGVGQTADQMLNKGSILGAAKGVLGIGKGILSAGLGGLEGATKFFLGSGPLVKLGIIGALGAIFKDPIEKYGPKIFGTAKDFFTQTVAPFMTQTALPAVLSGLGMIKDLIVENVPAIIDGAIQFAGGIAGGIIRWGKEKMGLVPKKKYLSPAEKSFYESNGYATEYDPTTGQYYVDQSGNGYQYDSAGNVMVDEDGNAIYETGRPMARFKQDAVHGLSGLGVRTAGHLMRGKAIAPMMIRGAKLGGRLLGGTGGALLGAALPGKSMWATAMVGQHMGAKAAGKSATKLAKGVNKVFSKTGANVATNAATEAGIDMAKGTAKKAGKETAEVIAVDFAKREVIGRTTEKTVKSVAKSASENKSVLMELVKKVSSFFAKLGDNKAVKSVLKVFGKDTKVVKAMAKTVEEQGENMVKNASDKVLKKMSVEVTDTMAKKGGKALADFIPFVGIAIEVGFGIWNGVTGWQEAARLFGVHKDEVDWKMKLISAVYKIITGISWAFVFDLLLDLIGMVTNTNPKQWLATWLYKAISGGEESLDSQALLAAQNNMNAEVQVYNASTGQMMSAADYSNMVNPTSAHKIGNFVTGKKDADMSKYREAAINGASTVSASGQYVPGSSQSSTTYGSDGKTNATINNITTNNYYGVGYENLIEPNYNPGYGPGPSNTTYNNSTNNYYGEGHKMKASYYGPADSMPVYKQNDSKWANQTIGTMPSGAKSTMASGGCGLTALASVASGLTKHAVTPGDVAKLATDSGYIAKGGATADLFTSGASKLGLSSTRVNPRQITEGLGQGKPVILAGKANPTDSGRTPFTKAGHVVTATGIDRHGNVQIADPMSGRRKSYPIDVVRRGMTDGWAMDRGSSGYGSPTDLDLKPRDEALGYGKFWDGVKKVGKSISNALFVTPEERAAIQATADANKKASAEKAAAAKSSATLKPNTKDTNSSNSQGRSRAERENPSGTRYIQPWDTSGLQAQRYYQTNGGYNISPSVAAYDPLKAEQYKQTFTLDGTQVAGPTQKYQPSNATPAAMMGSGKIEDEEPISLLDIGMGSGNPQIPSKMNRAFAEKVCILNQRPDIVKLLNAMSDDAFLDLRDYMISGRLWGNSVIDTPYVQKLNQIAKNGKSKKLKSSGKAQENPDEGRSTVHMGSDGREYGGGSRSFADTDSSKMTVTQQRNADKKAQLSVGHGNPVGYSGVIVNPFFKDFTQTSQEYVAKQQAKDVAKGLKAKALSIRNATPTNMYTTGLPNNRDVLVKAFLAARAAADEDAANIEAGLLSWQDITPMLYYGIPFYSADDPRWADIPYKSGTIQTNGHDILSMASLLSAYARKGITPKFLMEKALPDAAKKNSALFSVQTGVNWGSIFNKNNGLQTLPVLYDRDGKPLTVTKEDSSATAGFSSNLSNAIPMLLSGHEYTESAFGGEGSSQDPYAVQTTGGAVTLYGNDGALFDLNAFSDPTKLSPVMIARLGELIGPSADTKAMTPPAYLFSASNGFNPLDLPSDKKTEMDKQIEKLQIAESGNTIKDKVRDGFNIIADYLKRFTVIGKEFVSSKIMGRDYERQLDDEGNILTPERLEAIEKHNQDQAILNNTPIDSSFAPGDQWMRADGDNLDYVGKYVARFESGNLGSRATGSCGADKGGSFGDWQLTWRYHAKPFWNKYYAAKYGVANDAAELRPLWQKAIDDDPNEFLKNEHQYVADAIYTPALKGLSGTFNPDTKSRSAQESFWAWAVHVGGEKAASDFKKIGLVNPQSMPNTKLMNAIYDNRAEVMRKLHNPGIANKRYGTGEDSERALMISLGDMSPLVGNMDPSQGKVLYDEPIGPPSPPVSLESGTDNKKARSLDTSKASLLATGPSIIAATAANRTVGGGLTSGIALGINHMNIMFKKSAGYGNPVGYGEGDAVGYDGEQTTDNGTAKATLPAAATASFQNYLTDQRSQSTVGKVDDKNIGATDMFDNVNMVMNAGIRSQIEGISYEDALNEAIESKKAQNEPVKGDPALPGSVVYNSGGPVGTSKKVDRTPFAGQRQKVVQQILSREGKNQYSMNPSLRLQVATGHGDCSSTVQWATQTGAGINPGGDTGSQYTNGAGVFVDRTKGGPNESNLYLGDLLYYTRPNSDYTRGRKDRVGHVEMYIGNGTRMGHGGGTGPKRTTLSSNGGSYLGAKRFVGPDPNDVVSNQAKSGTMGATAQQRSQDAHDKKMANYGNPVGYGEGDSGKEFKRSSNLKINRKQIKEQIKRSTSPKQEDSTLSIDTWKPSSSNDGIASGEIKKTMNLLDSSSTYYGEGEVVTPMQGQTDLRQKVQVALNADGVENKLDGILEVLGAFFNYAKSQPKATGSNTYYGTAVNVNNNSKKSPNVMISPNGFSEDTRQVQMRNIHNGIAKRRY